MEESHDWKNFPLIIIIIFSQGDSISYKYNCYQEKPCIRLKKIKENCHS